MIQISREAAQVLRDYVGSTLPYGNVHVQAAANELEAALDKAASRTLLVPVAAEMVGQSVEPARIEVVARGEGQAEILITQLDAPPKCGGCPCSDGAGCA